MRRKERRRLFLSVVISLVILGGALVYIYGWGSNENEGAPAESPGDQAKSDIAGSPDGAGAESPDMKQAGGTEAPPVDKSESGKTDQEQPEEQPDKKPPVPAVKPPKAGRALSESEAKSLMQEGLRLIGEDKPVEARTALSKAIFSGTLSESDAEKARAACRDLARKTIFSSRHFPGDPYTDTHTFQSGQTLADGRAGGKVRPGVISLLDLRVPAALIEEVNKIPARRFQAGRSYKVVRGPFHGTVYKDRLVMDVYLARDGAPRTFVRRIPVGLGRNGSTPAGAWLVKAKAGGKGTKATWYPPPSSGLRGPIYPDHPKYAFGDKGLWIELQGVDDATRGQDGYGIHSTDDPASIGRADSLGCIRLGDDDIEFVFRSFFEGHSTVLVKK